jgi:hypothetical protein
MTAEKVGNHDVMFSPICFALAESCMSNYFSSSDLDCSGSAIRRPFGFPDGRLLTRRLPARAAPPASAIRAGMCKRLGLLSDPTPSPRLSGGRESR